MQYFCTKHWNRWMFVDTLKRIDNHHTLNHCRCTAWYNCIFLPHKSIKCDKQTTYIHDTCIAGGSSYMCSLMRSRALIHVHTTTIDWWIYFSRYWSTSTNNLSPSFVVFPRHVISLRASVLHDRRRLFTACWTILVYLTAAARTHHTYYTHRSYPQFSFKQHPTVKIQWMRCGPRIIVEAGGGLLVFVFFSDPVGLVTTVRWIDRGQASCSKP